MKSKIWFLIDNRSVLPMRQLPPSFLSAHCLELEAYTLWFETQVTERLVRVSVEAPDSSFDLLNAFCPGGGNSRKYEGAADTTLPMIGINSNLVNFEPGLHPSEGSLWEMLKNGQDVAYGLTSFLGDPHPSRGFLKNGPVPGRKFWKLSFLEMVWSMLKVKVLNKAIQLRKELLIPDCGGPDYHLLFLKILSAQLLLEQTTTRTCDFPIADNNWSARHRFSRSGRA